MNSTVTFEANPALKTRIDFACKVLGLDVSEIISEAFNAYFRKLITEEKIPLDLLVISQSQDKPETEYTFAKPELRTCKLTSAELSTLGKAHLKNYQQASQGNPKAQNVMGTYYESGNGLEKDYDKAIYWYTLAAEQGNPNAQYHLAVLYNKVKDNPLTAYYWFEVARMCGFNITALHKDYMLRIAERLSARQLETAQREAERKFSEIQKHQ
ncbi:MAG: SEL1-like repeat protein [Synergistaceae bacterium]|nr:SEL1-like repeat protein [Synergistaceae bacterium]